VFQEEPDAAGNPTPKYGEEFNSTFDRAIVKAQESFSFGFNDGDCRVLLFAEAIAGELVPGFNKSFDYYVAIECGGMSNVSGSTGTDLQTVRAEFYLDNCD